MNTNIRKEEPEDFSLVSGLVAKAFRDEKFSDHQEHHLVERLRKSQAFIPELSLICETENNIVGYILLTKIHIKKDNEDFSSLALAPVAVLPEFQGKGIGSKLIEAAHERAKNLGYQSIILLGHEEYYPRFGYRVADEFGISLPFEVPRENCMVTGEKSKHCAHSRYAYPRPLARKSRRPKACSDPKGCSGYRYHVIQVPHFRRTYG